MMRVLKTIGRWRALVRLARAKAGRGRIKNDRRGMRMCAVGAIAHLLELLLPRMSLIGHPLAGSLEGTARGG